MPTTVFDELVREAELDLLVEACGELGLDREEARSVLEMHLTHPGLLELVNIHGGSVRDFVASRLEIRRRIRASG